MLYSTMFLVLLKPAMIGKFVMRKALTVQGMTHDTMTTKLGHTLSYFEGGSGPTVVLVHGLQDHAGTWFQNVGWLMEDHRVLALELPGHGESGPDRGKIGIDDAHAFLDELIAQLPPEEKVTLVGNSLGGYVVLRWALENPNRVERVISVNGGGMPFVADRSVFMPYTASGMRATLRKVVGPDHFLPPDVMLNDFSYEVMRGPTPRLWDAIVAAEPLSERLGTLSVPFFVIWGAEDRLLPKNDGVQLAELGRGEFHSIPGCGHSPQLLCPEKFNPVLKSILTN